jgi:hypothetical protein
MPTVSIVEDVPASRDSTSRATARGDPKRSVFLLTRRQRSTTELAAPEAARRWIFGYRQRDLRPRDLRPRDLRLKRRDEAIGFLVGERSMDAPVRCRIVPTVDEPSQPIFAAPRDLSGKLCRGEPRPVRGKQSTRVHGVQRA